MLSTVHHAVGGHYTADDIELRVRIVVLLIDWLGLFEAHDGDRFLRAEWAPLRGAVDGALIFRDCRRPRSEQRSSLVLLRSKNSLPPSPLEFLIAIKSGAA